MDTRKEMTFGDAIDHLKHNGTPVRRAGWNGKGMYIAVAMQPKVYTDHLVFLSPYVNQHMAKDLGLEAVEVADFFVMRTADKKLVFGWLASQTDMLADDWEEVDPL